jgi:hypothetical protein
MQVNMANRFVREAINLSDSGAWAPYELEQNRRTIEQLTTNIYKDGTDIKINTGLIGYNNNDRHRGVIVVDTIETIDISGITSGIWAKIEVEVDANGTTPTFTATDIDGETDPTVFPSDIEDGTDYDNEKGGWYISSTKRLLGLIFIDSSDNIDGLVNILSAFNYHGWSIDSNAFLYRWDKIVEDTLDDNYVGKLHIIPEDERPSTYVLAAGSSTAPPVDVDFSSYVPKGVKALLLKYIFRWAGNNTLDYVEAYLGPNGNLTWVFGQTTIIRHYRTDLPSGTTIGHAGKIIVLCDEDGVIEYFLSDAAGDLWLNIIGYYLPENANE